MLKRFKADVDRRMIPSVKGSCGTLFLISRNPWVEAYLRTTES